MLGLHDRLLYGLRGRLNTGAITWTQLQVSDLHPEQLLANSTCRTSNMAATSASLDYYVLECGGPQVPYVEVRSLPDNQLVRRLQDNGRLREERSRKAFPRTLYRHVSLPRHSNGDAIMNDAVVEESVVVKIHLPPGLKEDGSSLYPLLIWMYVYCPYRSMKLDVAIMLLTGIAEMVRKVS